MRAVRAVELKGPRGLRIEEVPPLVCGPDEVRIRVRASALNRADLLQSRGLYPAPPGAPADILGLEYAGEVVERGWRATRWPIGARVMGLVGGGAWAEELTVHEREVAPMPATLDFVEAAAIPEAFVTAWDGLVSQGGGGLGSRILIHAVASGVGTAAAQLCRVLGATAVGTGRTAEKLDRVRALTPLSTVLVAGDVAHFAEEVQRAFGGRGADVVLDLVGGAWLAETIAAMAPRGRLVLVGLVGGASAQVPLAAVLSKRLTVQGTVLRSRPLEEKILAALQLSELVPLFERDLLRPVVDTVLPMVDVAAGLERLQANAAFGKIVVAW